MPHFFVDSEQISDGFVTIVGEDAHHISRSLRMAKGDNVTVCDMKKHDYECELLEFENGYVRARVISEKESPTEPNYRAHLFQALPKGDKLEYIIQKSVECGVYSITTFESERCIARSGDNDANKLKRRNKIAIEAAKQSRRGIIPEVKATVSFAKMLEEISRFDLVLFCYEGERMFSIAKVLADNRQMIRSHECDIAIVVGSEGGFSDKEVEAFARFGYMPVGLGSRILRTETASSFVLACLSYEFEL